ncbi:hypothetical protein KKD03_02970 [Patescibacteria group bacterium]|nr:hypothetical protein [Patescibacteria group bacterium]
MDKATQFNKVYANLPLHLRMEIVVVAQGEPFTWNSARLEIENNSDIGRLILDKLVKMEIIKK